MGEENALFLHLLGPLTIPDATYLSFTASICSHLTVRLLRILDPNHVHEELARALVSGRVRSPRGKRSIWRLSYKEGKRRKEEEEEWHTCLCRCRAGRSECGSSFRQRISVKTEADFCPPAGAGAPADRVQGQPAEFRGTCCTPVTTGDPCFCRSLCLIRRSASIVS